ncbi:DUF4998 domain-containing protein [Mariniflexile sp.]|uniref:DUF4998 domain-containing protein n=1 Tax=Mariniflexile sp. TaxID=1979402 RepID=UPI003563B8C8
MINNIKKTSLPLFLLAFCISIFNACTPTSADDYKKYTEGGEILYSGKLDSVKIFSGHNRIKLEGMLSPDPKVTSYRIYWSNKKDSIDVPVSESDIANTISKIVEGLEENIYNFEIRTFDDKENSSIPVFITGTVYGDRYINSLINRPLVKNTIESATTALIQFAPVDLTSGIFESEIEYIDSNNELQSFTVPVENKDPIVLTDFIDGNTFKYRSVFRPDPTCIDIFYTNYTVVTPAIPIAEAPYLNNAVFPFTLLESGGGRYGTPTAWIHNSGALNHGGYGVYDSNGGGGKFNLVSGYGEPNIINGKVYQKLRLSPGTYTYTVITEGNNYNGIDDQVYFTAALGNVLPDVIDVETSPNTLTFERVYGVARTYTLSFTLTQPFTDIAIGVALTNGEKASGGPVDRYMTIKSFALTKQ